VFPVHEFLDHSPHFNFRCNCDSPFNKIQTTRRSRSPSSTQAPLAVRLSFFLFGNFCPLMSALLTLPMRITLYVSSTVVKPTLASQFASFSWNCGHVGKKWTQKVKPDRFYNNFCYLGCVRCESTFIPPCSIRERTSRTQHHFATSSVNEVSCRKKLAELKRRGRLPPLLSSRRSLPSSATKAMFFCHDWDIKEFIGLVKIKNRNRGFPIVVEMQVQLLVEVAIEYISIGVD